MGLHECLENLPIPYKFPAVVPWLNKFFNQITVDYEGFLTVNPEV